MHTGSHIDTRTLTYIHAHTQPKSKHYAAFVTIVTSTFSAITSALHSAQFSDIHIFLKYSYLYSSYTVLHVSGSLLLSPWAAVFQMLFPFFKYCNCFLVLDFFHRPLHLPENILTRCQAVRLSGCQSLSDYISRLAN